MFLLNSNDPVKARIELQIAIAKAVKLINPDHLVRLGKALPVQPLIRIVNKHQPRIEKAIAATAIFMHPAAHRVTSGSKQLRALSAVATTNPGSALIGIKFKPTEPFADTLQFGPLFALRRSLGSTDRSMERRVHA